MTSTEHIELLADQRHAAERRLERQLQNLSYEILTLGSGVLEPDEVEPDLADKDRLEEVKEKFGWPSHDTDDDFRRTKGMTLEEFRGLLSDNSEEGLLNFRATLGVPPIEDFDFGAPTHTWQGMKPVLHRAYAVMPELMTDICQALETFSLSEQRGYLASDEATPTVEAMFVAYKVMTRLVPKSDGGQHDNNSHDVLTR